MSTAEYLQRCTCLQIYTVHLNCNPGKLNCTCVDCTPDVMSAWPLRSSRGDCLWVLSLADAQLGMTRKRPFSVIAPHLWNTSLHYCVPFRGGWKRSFRVGLFPSDCLMYIPLLFYYCVLQYGLLWVLKNLSFIFFIFILMFVCHLELSLWLSEKGK